MATDLILLTAARTAAVVASGEASAVEVAQAHLDRIAAVDGRVHAFLHVDTEGALAAACNAAKSCPSTSLTAKPKARHLSAKGSRFSTSIVRPKPWIPLASTITSKLSSW